MDDKRTVEYLPLAQWLSGRPAEHIIAISGHHFLTQHALQSRTAQIMRDVQCRPGRRCALCFADSFLFCAALLGCLYCGRRPVLLNTHQPQLAVRQAAQCDMLLTDLPECGAEALYVPESCAPAQLDDERTLRSALDPQALIVLQTSGTTGARKEICKSLGQLDSEARLTCREFAARLAGSVLCSSVYPMHLYGLSFRIFLPLSMGLPFCPGLIRYSEQLCALPADYRYALVTSPAFLRRLDYALPPPPLSLVLSAGSPLPAELARKLYAWSNVPADEVYGSTESGVIAWRCHNSSDPLWQLPSEISVEEAGDRQILHSPYAGGGSQGLTLEDRLQMQGPRHFTLGGRRDHIVKLEDRRVSLNEVRQQLLGCQGVRDCEVVPLAGGRRACLGAVVVLDSQYYPHQAGGRSLARQLRAQLRARLDVLCIPRRFVFMQAIPTDRMGKRVMEQLQGLFDAA